MPLFYNLPYVVMSSILIVASINLLELGEIIFLWRARAWVELALLFITASVSFIFNAQTGLLLSIVISIFIVMKHTSEPRAQVLGRIPGSNKFKDRRQFPEAVPVPGMLILRLRESIYFANMNMLKKKLWELEQLGGLWKDDPAASHPPHILIRTVIIDFKHVPTVDPSSAQILMEMIDQYRKRGVQMYFARLQEAHQVLFERCGLIGLVGPENIFSSVSLAVNALEDRGFGSSGESS